MAKIKIVEPGWLGYTGVFGVTEFENGISKNDVSPREIELIQAIVRSEVFEGEPPIDEPAPVEVKSDVKVSAPTVAHTQAELEAVADEKGIEGLRAIGAIYGVKGKAISELITKIMTAQGLDVNPPVGDVPTGK